MTIDDKIKNEKLQFNINRETAKISAFLSDKFGKYEYLNVEKPLPCDQSRLMEQSKFTYFLLGKAFEKQINIIEEKGKKQVEALEFLKPNTKKLTIRDEIPEIH